MTPEPAVRVELDVFSGRSNPTWILTSSQVEELITMLRRLPPGGRKDPPKLGWRGFLLYRLDPQGNNRPWLRVAGGAVSVSEDRRRIYRDTAGIGAWLREQAERKGFGTLLKREPPD